MGKAPGKYNLYLGAKYNGTRLNRLFAESLTPDGLVATLDPILHRYARERLPGEQFGDFCTRTVLAEKPAAMPA